MIPTFLHENRIRFLIIIIFELLFVYAISTFVNLSLSIKAGFIIVSTTLWYLIEAFDKENQISFDLSGSLSIKLFLVVASLSFCITVIFQQRLTSLLIGYTFLPVLILMTSRSNGNIQVILLESIFLLIFPIILKQIDTKFYVGNADLIVHIEFAQRILSTGSIDTIDGLYSTFPGYHILVSEISYITSISPQNLLFILGALTAVLLSLSTYQIARVFFNPVVGIYSIIGLIMIHFVHFYLSYIIPQMLTTTVILLSISIIVKPNNTRRRSSFLVLCLPLIFVHHLSFILMAPVGFWIILQGYEYRVKIPVVLSISVAASTIFYWVFNGKLFILGIFLRIQKTIEAATETSTTTITRSSFYFGHQKVVEPVSQSIRWLYTFDGLHQITLLTILLVASFAIILNERSRVLLITTPLIFITVIKTPLPLPRRVLIPACVIYAIFIGAGLYWSGAKLFPAKKTVITVIVVICIITSPLALADTIPNLRPDQGAHSDAHNQLTPQETLTMDYLEKYAQTPVSTFWLHGVAINNNPELVYQRPFVSSSGIVTDAPLFYYSKEWGGKKINHVKNGSFTNLVMSDQWIAQEITNSHHVYSNGRSGLIWHYGKR